jgi:C-terminal processing protease CtpA/Prc
VVLVVAGAAVWGVGRYGPRFGVYLLPPSPQQYADVALDLMSGGYRATGPAWDAARQAVRTAAADADDYADLHAALAEAVQVAGGPHSALLTPDEAAASQSAADEAPGPTVTTTGDVTTVVVPELAGGSPQTQQRYADTLADGIAAAAPATCGWVVDLRGNTGGTMYPMLSGVSALLPDGPALFFSDRHDRTTAQVTIQDDGAGLNGRTTTRVRPDPGVSGSVAVLQDERTASSGEVVLTAFRGLDDVTTFGAPSAGYTSANIPYRLYDGAQLVVTESVYVDRDGVVLDEQPLPAAHPTAGPDAEAAARGWLAEQGCAAG